METAISDVVVITLEVMILTAILFLNSQGNPQQQLDSGVTTGWDWRPRVKL